MNEPQRLLEIGNDEDIALLRSAKDDVPSGRAQARTLAALGVASSVMAASASTAAATTTGFSLIKWIGIGLAGTALIGGGVVVADQLTGEGAPAQEQLDAPAVVHAPAPAPLVAKHGAAVDDTDEEIEAEPEEPAVAEPKVAPTEPKAAPTEPKVPEVAAATPSPKTSPKTSAKAPKPASKKSSLAAEVAALDDARTAMEGGNANQALAALDRHDRKFDKGMLGPEATVLRIEVLIQAGQHAQAAALAQSFLAAHPSSPYAARVRTLLAQATSAR